MVMMISLWNVLIFTLGLFIFRIRSQQEGSNLGPLPHPLKKGNHGGALSHNSYGCVSSSDKGCDVNSMRGRHSFSELDMRTFGDDFVDYRRKVVMSWTPKAGCTQAVLMFLDDMGFKDGIDFYGWPHDFRKTFYHRCGKINPCIYVDDRFYRFKVVRNPYDRAVSSYLHIMKSRIVEEQFLVESIPRVTRKGEITFQDYLTYIERNSKTPMEVDLHDGSHVRKQCYDFEFYAWLEGKPIFNRIVKLEKLQEDIALVNKEAGTHFKTNFSSFHYAKRHEEDFYVGNISYEILKTEIPRDYGLFYNQEDIDRVYRLFFADLLVYNYTYPYHSCT